MDALTWMPAWKIRELIAAWPGREDVVLRVANAFQQAFPRAERPPVS